MRKRRVCLKRILSAPWSSLSPWFLFKSQPQNKIEIISLFLYGCNGHPGGNQQRALKTQRIPKEYIDRFDVEYMPKGKKRSRNRTTNPARKGNKLQEHLSTGSTIHGLQGQLSLNLPHDTPTPPLSSPLSSPPLLPFPHATDPSLTHPPPSKAWMAPSPWSWREAGPLPCFSQNDLGMGQN